jgi:hypothetical protein
MVLAQLSLPGQGKNGILHRVDGPAIISRDGLKVWYLDGKLHNINGPAIETDDGYQKWYQNGQLNKVESSNEIDSDRYNKLIYNLLEAIELSSKLK